MGATPVAPPASSKPLEPVPLEQSPAGGQPPEQPAQPSANNQAVPAVPPASSSAPARASDANLISWGWPAQGAVVQTEQTRSVWLAEGDKAVMRPVQTAGWIGSDWVVTGGLKPGEAVIVDNLIKMRPGVTVKPNG